MKLMEIKTSGGREVAVNPFKICSVEAGRNGKAVIRMSDGSAYKTDETFLGITERLSDIGKEGGSGHGSH